MAVRITRTRINKGANRAVKTGNQWLIDYFKGNDVFLLGGGASLKGFWEAGRLKELADRRVIAINHSYMYIKRFDVLVFLDGKFKTEVERRGESLEGMNCNYVLAGPSSIAKYSKKVCRFNTVMNRPSKNPNRLFNASQSGLCAINAALIGNAKRIFLLGFDCKFNGQGHFYSKEWTHSRDHDERAYQRPLRHYERFTDSRIYNCTTDSAIKNFKYMSIDDALYG
jgi:hypothetical protein